MLTCRQAESLTGTGTSAAVSKEKGARKEDEHEKSMEKIRQHLKQLFSADEAGKIEKMLRKGAVKE